MKKNKLSKYILTIVVSMYALTTLYPFVWLINQSIKTDVEYFLNQFAPPKVPIWENFSKAWVVAKFTDYFKNTAIVTIVSVILIVFVTSLAADAFARLKFIGSKLYLKLLILVLFIPSPVIIFPVYILVKALRINDTYIGLIGPYVCGAVPVATFIMLAAFKTIPKEMAESAKIDGCGEYTIWFKIMMPMVKASIATVAILNFMSVWNEYMWALVSISDKRLYTLSRGIVETADKVYSIGYGTMFAGMVITAMPVILLFIFLQKYFVSAIVSGAIKG